MFPLTLGTGAEPKELQDDRDIVLLAMNQQGRQGSSRSLRNCVVYVCLHLCVHVIPCKCVCFVAQSYFGCHCRSASLAGHVADLRQLPYIGQL